VEHGVDPVHGTRWTGGLDQVLGIGWGTKYHLTRDLRSLAGDERTGLQALDVRQQLSMGSWSAARSSDFVWWESLDYPTEHLRLASRRQGGKGCHECLPSRP